MKNKRCSQCRLVKDISKFHRDKTHKDGHRSRCAKCVKRTPSKVRESSLKNKYGITEAQYLSIQETQKDKCAVCGADRSSNTRKGKDLYVDHCHSTGKIRGLLCNGCNTGIGMLKDSTELIRAAINYLNKYDK